MLVFVYGTLKQGNRLNRALEHDTFICHTMTSDSLYDLVGGSGFPFMLRSPSNPGYRVRGDLYDVSEATLRRLDHIEGYDGPDARSNFYTRETILVKNGEVDEEAFVYLCNMPNRGNTSGIKIYPEDSSKSWSEKE